MRKLIQFLSVILMVNIISCQKEEGASKYEESDITAVQGVAYHYIVEEKVGSNIQKIVKHLNLAIKANLNKENKLITIEATVPASRGSFSDEERAKVSLKNLAVSVSISTAAKIYPIGDASTLGIPADWSKPNKYRVEANNGNSSEWTIEVNTLNK